MDSLNYILRALDFSYADLFSPKRDITTIQKRWCVMWFFKVQGRNYLEIARKLHMDHTSVRNGCLKIDDTLKALAEELYMRYASDELHENIPERPKKTITKKVPDYKHSCTVVKEIVLKEKPETILDNLYKRRWNR